MRKAISLILAMILIISVLPITTYALVDGGSWGGDNGSSDTIDWGEISSGAEFVATGTVLTKYNGSDSFVTVPTGVTAIDNAAFSSCKSVVTVIIPEGVTVIESFAFANCTKLKYVVLPKTIVKINANAFNGCSALEDVFYKGTKTNKQSITIKTSGNSTLTTALWHYNTCEHSAHVFSSSSDYSCNKCEWFKNHTHKYDDSCDETCNRCSRKRTAHSFVAATCTTAKKCKDCGKTEGTALGHKYDNDCDATCNTCGAKRSAGHTYTNDCDTSCNACGTKRTVKPHSYVAATCTTPKTCTKCNATTGTALGHSYSSVCDNDCNVCGKGRTAPHNYKTTYTTDGDYHWYSCMHCSAIKGTKVPHVYSNTEDLTCNVCGKTRTHIYDNSCDTKCNDCGSERLPNHNYQTKSTVDKHWQKCSVCGDETEKADHVFDNNCDRICNVCGAERSVVDHKYSSTSDRYCNYCNKERIIISKQPTSVTAAEGATVKFTAQVTGSGLNYQWELKSGSKWVTTSISGYQTNTITVPAASSRNGYQYRCVITDKYGNKVISSTSKLTVVATKITASPTSKNVALNDTATFSVTATGVGIKYQWQYKAPGGSWQSSGASGNKTSSLTVVAETKRNKYQYRCVITDGSGKKTYSSAATLTVVPVEVTKAPSSIKVATGDIANFTVSATGVGIKYQWQYKAPGSSWKNATATGNKTKTISAQATNTKNGYLYRCVVTDVVGNKVTSSYAKLTVVKTEITSNPKSIKVAANSSAKFTVAVSGVGIKYQWQYKTPSGSWKNTPATGNTTKTLTVSAESKKNGYQYRCVITDGAGKKTYSKAATLTVVATKITKQPVSVKTSSGTKPKMAITASGVGLKYQWQVKTPGGSWKNTTTSGYKTNTITITATKARNGYQYRCVVTDGSGKKTYSSAATLTVK